MNVYFHENHNNLNKPCFQIQEYCGNNFLGLDRIAQHRVHLVRYDDVDIDHPEPEYERTSVDCQKMTPKRIITHERLNLDADNVRINRT